MGEVRWLWLYVAVASTGFALANLYHWAFIFITAGFMVAAPWLVKAEGQE